VLWTWKLFEKCRGELKEDVLTDYEIVLANKGKWDIGMPEMWSLGEVRFFCENHEWCGESEL
jgi:hypothetical protein